jgi:uncharacterized protein YjbJ (UPF0337 family)
LASGPLISDYSVAVTWDWGKLNAAAQVTGQAEQAWEKMKDAARDAKEKIKGKA